MANEEVKEGQSQVRPDPTESDRIRPAKEMANGERESNGGRWKASGRFSLIRLNPTKSNFEPWTARPPTINSPTINLWTSPPLTTDH